MFYSYTATLEEKLHAWQEIVDTMPDCSMERRLNLPQIPSFHGFLREYIRALRNGVSDFLQAGNCVYCYSFHSVPNFCGDDGWGGESRLFSNFAACKAAYEEDGCYPDADLIRIHRRSIYHDSSSTCDDGDTYLFLNYHGQFILPPSGEFLLSNDPILLYFFAMWFDIPTPFRCGEIVQSIRPYGVPGRPRVLYYLPTCDKEALLKRGFPPNGSWLQYANEAVEKAHRTGDCSDMQAYGCGYDADGQLWIGDYGFASNYLDLENVTEPLKGTDRLLYGLREYLKGTIDAEGLLNTSNFIRLEEACKRQRSILSEYERDMLSATGIDLLP